MTQKSKFTLAAVLILLVLVIVLGSRVRRGNPSASGTVDPPLPTRHTSRVDRDSPSAPSRLSQNFAASAKLFANGEFPKLTPAQIEDYLESEHRSAGALLAAYLITNDDAFLQEAKQKFPENPQVLLVALQLSGLNTERLEIIARFKQADPGNGLGYGLAAREYFQMARNDEAMAELAQLSGKPVNDKTMVLMQDAEDAYTSAGLPVAEAKIASFLQSTKTTVMDLRDLANDLRTQRKRDEEAGNDAAVRKSRELQSALAREIRNVGSLSAWLVAHVLERSLLQDLKTPESQTRMLEMEQQRKSINEGAKKITLLMQDPKIPQSDWILYSDQVKQYGNKAANDWILAKYPDL